MLALSGLFVTVSELWLPLIGGIKTPGAFLNTNRAENRAREEEEEDECGTEGESGRSDSDWSAALWESE